MNNFDMDYLQVYYELGYRLLTTDNFNSKGYIRLVSCYIANIRMFNHVMSGKKLGHNKKLRLNE